jgi:hypothetical protein
MVENSELRADAELNALRVEEGREDLVIRHVDEIASSRADRERESERSRVRPAVDFPPLAVSPKTKTVVE